MTLARRVQAIPEWWPNETEGGEQRVYTLWRWDGWWLESGWHRIGATGWHRIGAISRPEYRRLGEYVPQRPSVRFRRG